MDKKSQLNGKPRQLKNATTLRPGEQDTDHETAVFVLNILHAPQRRPPKSQETFPFAVQPQAPRNRIVCSLRLQRRFRATRYRTRVGKSAHTRHIHAHGVSNDTMHTRAIAQRAAVHGSQLRACRSKHWG